MGICSDFSGISPAKVIETPIWKMILPLVTPGLPEGKSNRHLTLTKPWVFHLPLWVLTDFIFKCFRTMGLESECSAGDLSK